MTTFLVGGCASLTTNEELTTSTRASLPPLPAQWKVDGAMPGDIRIGWIDALRDPALSAFVREAQIANRDIQATAANVEAAYALVRQARSGLFPAIDLSTTGGQSQVIDEPGAGEQPSEAFFTPDYDVSLQASWEVDLWGRVRAGRNAAYASAQAVEADFRFAQYSLAASVASAYFAVIESERQIDVAERNYAAYAEIDRITRFRAREGYSNQQDVSTAASDLADVLEGLEEARGARRIAIRALEVLLGRYPGAQIEGGFEFPEAPPPPAAGLPSELLERRPDVIAAERNVAAAFSNLDQAKAARLPTLSLSASVGGTSSELDDIADGRNLFWSIIGNVLQPIFDAGLRGARVEEADADKRAAIATYASTALTALQEVEDNLDQVEVVRLREQAAKTARDAAVEAVKLGELRYKEGETDLIDLLSLRQRQLSAEQNYVSIQRERIDQWVSLNLALGGSWIEPSQQAEP
ncbi:MAG: efflux transporter outer membrane subunit [Pseudomonadota bacterium]